MIMKVHKEGYSILFVTLAILAVLCAVAWLILPNVIAIVTTAASVLLMAFLTRFFRVPSRQTETNQDAVYSPADGTVVAIEEVEENEYLKTRCIQVSIFMSVWNVHINWFPVSGVVRYFRYHPGDYLVAWHPKSSSHNERTTVVVERADGVKVLLRQIAGAVARRIVCYAEVGNTVNQCSELGFIKFGSRVDVFLPLNADIKVTIGQKVTGNVTVIATV
jgi:phosphatidylserine decarboxylase